MDRQCLRFLNQSLRLSLLLVVTLVCSLPRAVQAEDGRMGISFGARGSSLSTVLNRASSPLTGAQGLDSRLLQIRKFRRRHTAWFFQAYLQKAFLCSPSLGRAENFLRDLFSLQSRIPDPLVHPPT